MIYTRYDSRNGLFRLEQAHNDYLQVLSDGGIVWRVLALEFRRDSVSKGAFASANRETISDVELRSRRLGGCFAVLVHSFFDFTLHTTSNALLFLVLAAIATMNGRVEDAPAKATTQEQC